MAYKPWRELYFGGARGGRDKNPKAGIQGWGFGLGFGVGLWGLVTYYLVSERVLDRLVRSLMPLLLGPFSNCKGFAMFDKSGHHIINLKLEFQGRSA